MHTRPAPVLLVVLLLALTPGAQAQSLTPGTRLRVATPDGRQIGYVERMTADSLVMANPGQGRTALAWAEVGRAEYSLGRRGNPGRGALIGAGAMTGLAILSSMFDNEDHYYTFTETVTLGALFGAGVGALAGLAWRTERWAALPVGPTRASAARPDLGPGLTLTLQF